MPVSFDSLVSQITTPNVPKQLQEKVTSKPSEVTKATGFQDVMNQENAPNIGTDEEPHFNIDEPNIVWETKPIELFLPPFNPQEDDIAGDSTCRARCAAEEIKTEKNCDTLRKRVALALEKAGCPSYVMSKRMGGAAVTTVGGGTACGMRPATACGMRPATNVFAGCQACNRPATAASTPASSAVSDAAVCPDAAQTEQIPEQIFSAPEVPVSGRCPPRRFKRPLRDACGDAAAARAQPACPMVVETVVEGDELEGEDFLPELIFSAPPVSGSCPMESVLETPTPTFPARVSRSVPGGRRCVEDFGFPDTCNVNEQREVGCLEQELAHKPRGCE